MQHTALQKAFHIVLCYTIPPHFPFLMIIHAITWSRSLSLQDLMESTGTNVIAASAVASSCTRQPFVENSMQYPLLPLAVYNGKQTYSDYCLTSAPIPWKSEWIRYCLGPKRACFSVFKKPLCCFSRDGPWQRFLGISILRHRLKFWQAYEESFPWSFAEECQEKAESRKESSRFSEIVSVFVILILNVFLEVSNLLF